MYVHTTRLRPTRAVATSAAPADPESLSSLPGGYHSYEVLYRLLLSSLLIAHGNADCLHVSTDTRGPQEAGQQASKGIVVVCPCALRLWSVVLKHWIARVKCAVLVHAACMSPYPTKRCPALTTRDVGSLLVYQSGAALANSLIGLFLGNTV